MRSVTHGREHAVGGRPEHVGPHEQADHEVAVAWEVEEVSGMDEHVVTLQQPNHTFVFRHGVRNADHGRPAAFGFEQGQHGMAPHRCAKTLEILPYAREDLTLQVPSRLEQPAGGQLDRRRDGQICVGNELQPLERLVNLLARAAHGDPGELQLRERGRLRQPAEREGQGAILAGLNDPGFRQRAAAGSYGIAPKGSAEATKLVKQMDAEMYPVLLEADMVKVRKK